MLRSLNVYGPIWRIRAARKVDLKASSNFKRAEMWRQWWWSLNALMTVGAFIEIFLSLGGVIEGVGRFVPNNNYHTGRSVYRQGSTGILKGKVVRSYILPFYSARKMIERTNRLSRTGHCKIVMSFQHVSGCGLSVLVHWSINFLFIQMFFTLSCVI